MKLWSSRGRFVMESKLWTASGLGPFPSGFLAKLTGSGASIRVYNALYYRVDDTHNATNQAAMPLDRDYETASALFLGPTGESMEFFRRCLADILGSHQTIRLEHRNPADVRPVCVFLSRNFSTKSLPSLFIILLPFNLAGFWRFAGGYQLAFTSS